MFWHGSREKHGFRAWLHYGAKSRRVVSTEVNWWARFCHVGVECGDEGWLFSVALPPLAVWLRLDIGLPVPRAKHVFHWDNDREVWLPDRREFKVAIHDWTVWLTPWGRWGEWRTSDPWWIRGVNLNVRDLVLGRACYSVEDLACVPVQISMPEGVYHGVATVRRQTWKRPRWFADTRLSTNIDVPKGIPFAGKGENSWDCGDDGLFGCGAEGGVENAVRHFREQVLQSRKRHGMPSEQAIQEALS